MKPPINFPIAILACLCLLFVVACTPPEESASSIDETIYYTSYHDGFSEIHELRTATGEVVDHSNASFLDETPGEFFFPEGDYNPEASPDGMAVMFSSSKRPEGEIFIIEPDVEIRTIELATEAANPVWSNTQDKIAYVASTSGGPNSLYVLNLTGEDPVQVTFPEDGSSELAGGHCFAATPGVIIFSRKISETNYDLLALNLNTPEFLPLHITNTPNFLEQDPKVSADGKYIAYQEYGIAESSRKIKVFLNDNLNTPQFELNLTDHPTVGPNSAGYDFTSDANGLIISLEKKVSDAFGNNANYELYYFDFATSELTQLTDNDFPDTQPSVKKPGFANIDWFTDRGNIPHQAYDNGQVTLPLTKRWEIDLDTEPTGQMFASVVGSFGRLFVGMDSIMHCINPINGNTLWTYKDMAWIHNPATVATLDKGNDRRLFFMNNNGRVAALNAINGDLLWTKNVWGINQRPTAALEMVDGVLYYQASGPSSLGFTEAISMIDGNELWSRTDTISFVRSILHGIGSVFIPTYEPENFKGTYVRLRDDTGAEEWIFDTPYPEHNGNFSGTEVSYSTGGVLYTDVAIGEEPAVIFAQGINPPRVVALNAFSGTSKWIKMVTHDGFGAGFAATSDRNTNALIFSTSNTIYSLNPVSGEIIWEFGFEANENQFSEIPRPTIWGDYVFQVVDANSKLVALDINDGSLDWEHDLEGDISYASPAIGQQSLYLTTAAGKVMAFSSFQF